MVSGKKKKQRNKETRPRKEAIPKPIKLIKQTREKLEEYCTCEDGKLKKLEL